MNRQERRAAQARGQYLPSAMYVDQIEAMARAIAGWLRAHPDQAPLFWVPPKDVMVIVDLPSVVDRIARNDAARQIADLLIESAPPSKVPTLLMLRVALEHAKCPGLVVPLEVFTAGFVPLPTQPGGHA